jgi:hypothetical protein
MTNQELPFETDAPTSRRDRAAALFRRKEGEWIPATELLQFGIGGWRTRVSECRTILGMDIVNRQRHLKNGVIISEYKFNKEAPCSD